MRHGINLDALQVLDAIATKESFSAAADKLHRAPSSVTYAIQKLEESLGVSVFDRRGHRAHLTPAGEALLRDGRDLLARAEEVSQNVKRIATGWEAEVNIILGDLVSNEKILDVCGDFFRVAPEIHLRFFRKKEEAAWEALSCGSADVIIGATGEAPAGGGYSVKPLGTVEPVFVVAPHHPLAEIDETLSNDDIRRHRAVTVLDDFLKEGHRIKDVLPGQEVLTIPDLNLKYEALKRGMGVGYLPRHVVANDIALGRLVERETEDKIAETTAYYAWRTNRHGRALTWFKEHLCGYRNLDWFTPQLSSSDNVLSLDPAKRYPLGEHVGEVKEG